MRTSARRVFFFQAEDGIRDLTVTGVQTCALPIFPLAADGLDARVQESSLGKSTRRWLRRVWVVGAALSLVGIAAVGYALLSGRSEERRVGKECRSWWTPCH